MINKTACREVLEFLDAIEGQGYGGMASFETARLHARIALEMAGKQDGAGEFERLIPSRLAEAFGVSWEVAQKAQDKLGWLYRQRATPRS